MRGRFAEVPVEPSPLPPLAVASSLLRPRAGFPGKTKHLACYCACFGTLLTMGLMKLLGTRPFWVMSVATFATLAFYGLGLSVVQGLPLTPNIKLTMISRYGPFPRIILAARTPRGSKDWRATRVIAL